jgi:dTMP kinase
MKTLLKIAIQKTMKVSKFIVFEGVDGCGKSTQIQLLAKQLRNLGHEVLITREPGGTKTAEQIRSVLKQPAEPLDLTTELLLFSAARCHHVNNVIKPALEKGQIVLCDRYYLSSLVYQQLESKVSKQTLQALELLSFDNLFPDLTFVFDLSLEVCLERIRLRNETPDHFENTERLKRVISAYKNAKYPNKPSASIAHINAAQPVEEVEKLVWTQCVSVLGN